jgi:hypothetical protein
MSDTDPAALAARIEALERRNILADTEHAVFRNAEALTARAVEELTRTLNDPRSGLIVELANFRAEVLNDRRAFKAWIAGAAAAISLVFTVITVYAPALRAVVGVTP